jgi:Flp pilus assembly protein TadG
MRSLSNIRRRGLRRARREEGQALVELALAMPLLLLLVMAIIQFGIMLSEYSSLVNAGRAGARALALGRGLSNPCDPAVKAAMASTAGQFSIPSSDITPSFSSTKDFCGTSSGCTYVYASSCNTSGNENQSDDAEVTITYPYTLSVFGLGVMHLTLSTSSTDAVE